MLQQEQKKENQKENKSSVLQNLVKKQNVTKTVKVKYKSCCGCGCSYQDYTLTVPVDLNIENGDIIKDYDIIDKYN